MTPGTADFVRAYLREAPLFAAIVRGVECSLMREAGPFAEPVLDLGCGDGLFAALAFPSPAGCGIDMSASALTESRRRRAHCGLAAADATALPFGPDTFSTVIANSVLEHIPKLEPALDECRRVLRPGGRLIVTAPSHLFGKMLLGSRFIPRYAVWFNGHSRHFHTYEIEHWDRLLGDRGFRVERSFYYLSPRAHRVFDAMHYASAWRWLCRRMTGRWTWSSQPWANVFWEKWFDSLTAGSWPSREGPYLFIDATKVD